MIRKNVENQHKRRRKKTSYTCDCCGGTFPFCWTCRHDCSFQICQNCMDENTWGLTCNNINWECPDCGGWNGYGNQ